MANALYEKYLQACVSWSQAGLAAPIDLFADDVRFVYVDTAAYVVNLATDQFLSDIPPAAIIATSPLFTGKTSAAGVFDANDVTTPPFVGPSIEALVIFKDTGVAASSPLVVYIDTTTNAALPFNPGATKIVQWPAPGIFGV